VAIPGHAHFNAACDGGGRHNAALRRSGGSGAPDQCLAGVPVVDVAEASALLYDIAYKCWRGHEGHYCV